MRPLENYSFQGLDPLYPIYISGGVPRSLPFSKHRPSEGRASLAWVFWALYFFKLESRKQPCRTCAQPSRNLIWVSSFGCYQVCCQKHAPFNQHLLSALCQSVSWVPETKKWTFLVLRWFTVHCKSQKDVKIPGQVQWLETCPGSVKGTPKRGFGTGLLDGSGSQRKPLGAVEKNTRWIFVNILNIHFWRYVRFIFSKPTGIPPRRQCASHKNSCAYFPHMKAV